MECNGKLLTEEQIDRLQFMLNNYYKKSMDICSCDVERVLNKKEVELTKVEKAIVIATILHAIDEEELEEYVELEKLLPLIKVLDGLYENTTPKVKKEATVSLINKLIDDFLKGNKAVDTNETIQNNRSVSSMTAVSGRVYVNK